MSSPLTLNTHELMLRDRVIATLNSSLSLPQVLEATQAPLLELTPADSVALCLMRITPSLDFQWLVPGPRFRLLDEYADLSDHDFARPPIFAQPNVVLRDSEMLSRREYEHSLIYQRSRELDLSLEHIMAVLVPVRPDFLGALALYRTRRRSFSSRCAAVLSSLTAHLMNAVRNCSDVQAFTTGAHLLEDLYRRPDTAFLVVEPPHREVLRSPHAAVLLDRWFAPSDLHSSGLPLPLKERLDTLVRLDPDSRLEQNVWVSLQADGYRTVRFVELPAPEGPRQWALLMNEIPISIPLPAEMKRKLTPREVTIAMYLLRNWSDKQIADELDITLLTLKTHSRNIRNKLGIDGRADFIYQAARLNKPV
ncbi:helix-turn-helix transcriptional regulator [Stigmatella sp. ncwal1]|uniref:Helix-turn-helix transcriptional regulator n=1 Tax=Stigmatella ashevillensis TaxID=2995309 RepID=A0ABT5D587_9BACT|nr:helix-turn-helix transcriptional regulator [Stigmatella ashevillena]MDC0707416.1 helix-turn-helix transcriptional regulator [Stigmatella ashevillena]